MGFGWLLARRDPGAARSLIPVTAAEGGAFGRLQAGRWRVAGGSFADTLLMHCVTGGGGWCRVSHAPPQRHCRHREKQDRENEEREIGERGR